MAPPDRLCDFCHCPMTPANTVEACLDCLGIWRRIELILTQIRQVYDITKTMTQDKVFKVLWEFKWKHREIGG